MAMKITEGQKLEIKHGVAIAPAGKAKKKTRNKKKGAAMSPSPPSANGAVSMQSAYSSLRSASLPGSMAPSPHSNRSSLGYTNLIMPSFHHALHDGGSGMY